MAKENIEKLDVVSKLIDIENKCQKFKPFSEAEQEMYRMICETEIGIGKTPAADVVEVVRCRECVYNANGCCVKSEWYDDTRYRPDYFCADGERGDNNAAD